LSIFVTYVLGAEQGDSNEVNGTYLSENISGAKQISPMSEWFSSFRLGKHQDGALK